MGEQRLGDRVCMLNSVCVCVWLPVRDREKVADDLRGSLEWIPIKKPEQLWPMSEERN